MVFVTLYLAYWRWDRSMWRDTDHVMVKIYRVTQVPTAEMIADNEATLSGWNNGSIGGGNEFYLRTNSIDVNFATLTLSFFAISAVFHLWACIVGLFDRFWYVDYRPSQPHTNRLTRFLLLVRRFIYWRQLDNAFAWWRWLECRPLLQPTSPSERSRDRPFVMPPQIRHLRRSWPWQS